METQTEQINKALNDGFKSITERWKKEDKLNKEIRKENKGLILLYEKGLKNQSVIVPYYLLNEIKQDINLYCYGSRGYHNKRELTTEEHIKYFKLLDKLKRINKQIDKFKDGLK